MRAVVRGVWVEAAFSHRIGSVSGFGAGFEGETPHYFGTLDDGAILSWDYSSRFGSGFALRPEKLRFCCALGVRWEIWTMAGYCSTLVTRSSISSKLWESTRPVYSESSVNAMAVLGATFWETTR